MSVLETAFPTLAGELQWIALGDFPVALAPVVAHLPMALVYLGKTFVPLGLSVYPSLADAPLWPGFAGLALLAGLALALRRDLLGRAGVGLLWYLAFLAPVDLEALAGNYRKTGPVDWQ